MRSNQDLLPGKDPSRQKCAISEKRVSSMAVHLEKQSKTRLMTYTGLAKYGCEILQRFLQSLLTDKVICSILAIGKDVSIEVYTISNIPPPFSL